MAGENDHAALSDERYLGDLGQPRQKHRRGRIQNLGSLDRSPDAG